MEIILGSKKLGSQLGSFSLKLIQNQKSKLRFLFCCNNLGNQIYVYLENLMFGGRPSLL